MQAVQDTSLMPLMYAQIKSEMELAHRFPWITDREPPREGQYLVSCISRDEQRDVTYRYVRIEAFEKGEWVRGGYYQRAGWYWCPEAL